MKFLVALAALFVAVNAVEIEEIADKWISFKTTHSKEYHPKEEQKRFRIFQDNLKKIEEHNAKYESGEVSYYFGVNQFADLTGEEFLSMMNAQISTKPEINGTLFEADPKATVPDSIDWRSSGAVLPVKNQDSCGSCWAFSATGALEGQIVIKTGKQQELSNQQLVDCSTQNSGCNGGWMDWAFNYVRLNGICSEDSYPYSGYEGTCQQCTKVLSTIKGFAIVASDEDSLKTAVGTKGPVSVAVNANLGWQFYTGGIYNSALCNLEQVNHGVLVAGYGSERGDYWLIKNSWGSTWGESGYMRLSRGSNQCHVADIASYPQL